MGIKLSGANSSIKFSTVEGTVEVDKLTLNGVDIEGSTQPVPPASESYCKITKNGRYEGTSYYGDDWLWVELDDYSNYQDSIQDNNYYIIDDFGYYEVSNYLNKSGVIVNIEQLTPSLEMANFTLSDMNRGDSFFTSSDIKGKINVNQKMYTVEMNVTGKVNYQVTGKGLGSQLINCNFRLTPDAIDRKYIIQIIDKEIKPSLQGVVKFNTTYTKIYFGIETTKTEGVNDAYGWEDIKITLQKNLPDPIKATNGASFALRNNQQIETVSYEDVGIDNLVVNSDAVVQGNLTVSYINDIKFYWEEHSINSNSTIIGKGFLFQAEGIKIDSISIPKFQLSPGGSYTFDKYTITWNPNGTLTFENSNIVEGNIKILRYE